MVVGMVIGIAVLTSFPTDAVAARQTLGQFGLWWAFSLTEGKRTACYLYAEPTKQQEKDKSRDRTFVQITHRPAEKVHGEVSFTAGYTYKKGAAVIATVDTGKHTLFSDGDTAWSRDGAGDAALVKAMIKGRTLVLTGTSSRGTKTTDIYALAGFTKAYGAISKACSN